MSVDEGDTLYADGLEEAFIGLGAQFTRSLAVYSTRKVLELLVRQGLTPEEAQEHFDFNIVGAYVGEFTPVFLDDTQDDERVPEVPVDTPTFP